MKEKFLAGAAREHQISRQLGEEIFALLQHFAGYGFNKSHSAAYALWPTRQRILKPIIRWNIMAAFLNSVDHGSGKSQLVYQCLPRYGHQGPAA